MRNFDFDVHELIEKLRGSSYTIEYVLELHFEGTRVNDITDEEKDIIDNELFYCKACGCWLEVDEKYTDETCNTCAGVYDGDGDGYDPDEDY